MFWITKDTSSGTTHIINICEPLQVISVKVQVITP